MMDGVFSGNIAGVKSYYQSVSVLVKLIDNKSAKVSNEFDFDLLNTLCEKQGIGYCKKSIKDGFILAIDLQN